MTDGKEIEIDFSKIGNKVKKWFKGDSKEIEFDLSKIEKYSKNWWFYYVFLIPILYLGWWIRTRNLDLLRGKYLVGLDPYYFFRLTKLFIEGVGYGTIDYMRNAPLGNPFPLYDLFPMQMAYFFKFFKLFGLSQIEWHIIYPVVSATIGFFFFYLFVKEYLNEKVALISTLFLVVVPAFLFRTVAGFADHEALALMWMFISLYLFELFRKEMVVWKKFSFAGLSGLFAGLMGVTWAAFPILIVPLAGFMLFELLFERVDKKYILGYGLFSIVFLIVLTQFFRLNFLIVAVKNYSVQILGLSLFSSVAYLYLEKLKLSVYDKIPAPLMSVFLVFVPGLAIAILTGLLRIKSLFFMLVSPAHLDKVALTTSELASPNTFGGGNSLWGSFEWVLFFGFVGSIFLMYYMFRSNKKIAYATSALYGVICGLAFFGRWSPSLKIVNESYVYFLGAFVFLFLVGYLYLKNRHPGLFDKLIQNVDSNLALGLVGFGFTIILARSAVRFFFVAAPFVALTGGYFLVKAIEELQNIRSYRWFSYALVVFAVFIVLSLSSASAGQAGRYGSGLPGQWEDAMVWLRENTDEDAVVAHWWDYGYWTQTVAERASVNDGGKPGGSYGIFTLARYGMTAHDPNAALTYFKTREVTHLLYSEEEIGKYHAFSFLGSDENDDRRSTIGIFSLSQTQEVRKGFRNMYVGGWGFDKDIVLDELVLAKDESGIGGFMVEVDEEGGINDTPIAIVMSKERQIEIPVSCAYFGDDMKKVEWEVENPIGGCIVMVPQFNDDVKIVNGALFYLSDKVEPGLFAQLYILGKDIDGFKEVYRDKSPLGLYAGRVIGPIIIWELNYPENIKEDPTFLADTSEEFERSYKYGV